MTAQEALDYFIRRKAQLGISDKIQQAETLAISALKKQVPKKPYKTKEHKQNNWYCSICRCYLGDDMELQYACLQPKFCEHCGHAIDWSDFK